MAKLGYGSCSVGFLSGESAFGWWVAVVLVSALGVGAVGLSVLLGGDSPDVTVVDPWGRGPAPPLHLPGAAPGARRSAGAGSRCRTCKSARSALAREPRTRRRVGRLAPAALPDRSGHPPARSLRPVGRPHRRRLGHPHVDVQRHRREPPDRGSCSTPLANLPLTIFYEPLDDDDHAALPDLRRADGPRGRGRGGRYGTGELCPALTPSRLQYLDPRSLGRRPASARSDRPAKRPLTSAGSTWRRFPPVAQLRSSSAEGPSRLPSVTTWSSSDGAAGQWGHPMTPPI